MFKDRREAGEKLAEKLKGFKEDRNVVIFGIPRGGMVVASVVAHKLNLPMSAVIVKKIGAPQNPELAIGSTAGAGVVFWDEEIISELGVSEEQKEELLKEKERERKAREEFLGVKIPDLKGKMAVVVDDGVATGSTAIAAALFLREKGAREILLATPVVAKDRLNNLGQYFDKVVYLLAPEFFYAVGEFYKDFPQISDEEVRTLLAFS